MEVGEMPIQSYEQVSSDRRRVKVLRVYFWKMCTLSTHESQHFVYEKRTASNVIKSSSCFFIRLDQADM